MPETTKPDRLDRFQKKAQIFVLLSAFLWGCYTFVYKEIWVPKSAPVNITMGLELKQAGEASHSTKAPAPSLLPVEVEVSAKNPSSRPVYLLPNFWVAYGIKIVPAAKDANPFQQGFVITAQTGTESVQRHASEAPWVVVAYGRLLQDEVLKPSETAARRMIFYVPQHEYDLVRVMTSLPTVDKAGVLDIEYTLDEKNGVQTKAFRLDAKGGRSEMKTDKNGNYTDTKIELQRAMSEADLSLH